MVLSDDDAVAALQILAHLAYPHRPEFALEVLRQWDLHLGDASPREKWNVVKRKLIRLDDMVHRHLMGAYWLQLQINNWLLRRRDRSFKDVELFLKAETAGQRECARRFGHKNASEANTIRKYWTETRSVAHLGLATGDAILQAGLLDGPAGDRWDLARIAFRPVWVERALKDAETYAVMAERAGVIPLRDAVRFARRDDI